MEKVEAHEQPCSEPEPEQPYTIDSTNLCEYYKKLKPDQISEDVDLLKVASIRERYQLIASDCLHYVSIIENYKEENLQNLCQIVIRRVEGHLIVKFRLNTSDRWSEVGFYDDDNTDRETIDEVKRMINLRLKDQGQSNEDRREHLLAQFEEGEMHETKPAKKAIPDDYFSNVDLKPTAEQMESAGYDPVPDHLKHIRDQLVGGSDQSFDVSQFNGVGGPIETRPPKQQASVLPPQSSLPAPAPAPVDEFKDMLSKQVHDKLTGSKDDLLGQLKSLISEGDHKPYQDLTETLISHQRLIDIFKCLGSLAQTLPRSCGSHIQQFATQIVDTQEPDLIASVLLDLTTQVQAYQVLTPNQKEICQKYGINPSQ
jgi:hypothetical protein